MEMCMTSIYISKELRDKLKQHHIPLGYAFVTGATTLLNGNSFQEQINELKLDLEKKGQKLHDLALENYAFRDKMEAQNGKN